ncbi:MAG: hypothetical protein COB30_014810 [Ectothiorhodospiraceae bacterium]|nr:hypothetical protein [Ectothiorhodospiraceae bacterium]
MKITINNNNTKYNAIMHMPSQMIHDSVVDDNIANIVVKSAVTCRSQI